MIHHGSTEGTEFLGGLPVVEQHTHKPPAVLRALRASVVNNPAELVAELNKEE
jgi:hypothetical protein